MALWVAAPTDLDLAVELYQQGEFERALKLLEAVAGTAEIPAARAQASLYKGYCEAVLGRSAQAARSFEQALAAEPELQPDRARLNPAVIKVFDTVRAGLRGTLAVRSDRPAELVVDGQPSGTTPFEGIVAIGRHRLELRSIDRNHAVAQEVVVGPGAVVRIDAILQPRDGVLSLTSTPSGCEVWEGDRRVGTTPMTDWILPAGPHSLSLRRDGFRLYALEARVDPERPTQLQVTLEVEATGRSYLWPAVLGGTSVALLVGGIIVGVLADRDADEIQGGGAIEWSRYEELKPRARNEALAANLAYGAAGGAALAAGLVFWFTGQDEISATVSSQGMAVQGRW